MEIVYQWCVFSFVSGFQLWILTCEAIIWNKSRSEKWQVTTGQEERKGSRGGEQQGTTAMRREIKKVQGDLPRERGGGATEGQRGKEIEKNDIKDI